MEVFRQRLVIDVVWARQDDKDPKIDWESELAQALNEAGEYCGTIWSVEPGPLEKLK